MTTINRFDTPKDMYDALTRSIIELTKNNNNEAFHIALSGGNSPKGLFAWISENYATALPWSRIHFWWGDERCVSPNDEQSNYKMTKDFLLDNIEIPAENVHRVLGENNPQQEAERYDAELCQAMETKENTPVFDLIILGMGDDGHTASIFPHQIELLESAENCAVATHPESGQIRVSLSGKVLNSARNVFFLVSGQNKAQRIFEIMNKEEIARTYPASYIAPATGKLTWFLDSEAAALI